MATIRRGTIVANIIDALKLQVGNVLPNDTSDKLVLTFDYSNSLNCDIVRHSSLVTSGSGTLYTVPSDKDFYLKYVTLSVVKDATCDMATGAVGVSAIIGGAARGLLAVPVLVTTAQNQSTQITFPTPIKIDRGTGITISGTYTAGLMARYTTIGGFTTDG